MQEKVESLGAAAKASEVTRQAERCCCGGNAGTSVVQNCGEQKTYCIQETKRCCNFDIVMTRMRVLKSNDGMAELMVIGYANDQQAAFPGMGMWVQMWQAWGWRNIQRKIASFCVGEGESLIVRLNADAIEAGRTLEGNFEIGSSENPKYLTLTCGSSPCEYLTVDMKGVKSANAGNVKASVEIEFIAVQTTGCGCHCC